MPIRDGKYSDPEFGINTQIRNTACPFVKSLDVKVKTKNMKCCNSYRWRGRLCPTWGPGTRRLRSVRHMSLAAHRSANTTRSGGGPWHNCNRKEKLTQTLYQRGGSRACSQIGSIITVQDPDLTTDKKSVIFLQNARIPYVFDNDYNFLFPRKIFICLPPVPSRKVKFALVGLV